MPITVRANYPDLDLLDALPFLDEIVETSFEDHPEQYSEIFNVKSSTRAVEQTSQLVGLGLFQPRAETEPVTYDKGEQGYSKDFIHDQFASGFRVSRLMIDDDKFSIAAKLAEDLGRSARHTVELRASAMLNNGFDGAFPGPDGVALFSASHPSPRPGVPLRSNVLAVPADLDPTSIQLLLTQMRRAVDPSGKKHVVRARRLIVPPESEFLASVIMNSTLDPTSANNAINPLLKRQGGPFREYFVYDWLLDPDGWMIQCERHDARFYWREKPKPVHDVDFDTRSTKTAMWMRYSFGWGDHQGWYGTPGN